MTVEFYVDIHPNQDPKYLVAYVLHQNNYGPMPGAIRHVFTVELPENKDGKETVGDVRDTKRERWI